MTESHAAPLDLGSVEPTSTDYVVIRPQTDLADSSLASVSEGEWRRRADLVDEDVIEILGPSGIARAYPVDRIERSPAGDLAQVYEVPDSDEGDANAGADSESDSDPDSDPDADSDSA